MESSEYEDRARPDGGGVQFAEAMGHGASVTLVSTHEFKASKRDLAGKGGAGKKSGEERDVEINSYGSNEGFVSNLIVTRKYTVWNVLPKSLWEQFRKVSNFYFLIVAIITFIPGVTSFSPSTAVIPLVLVVGFSMGRELYDDFNRGRADNKSNNEPYEILERDTSKKTETMTVPSRQVTVGDILVIKKNQTVPADCVALMSSEDGGVLYVSTASLDGETNLKRHQVTMATKDLTTVEQVHELKGSMTVAPPNAQFEVFQGRIKLSNMADPLPVDASNLMLRGSTLRNTEKVYALVAYTGVDSKIALNMRDPPSKLCRLDKTLNWTVFFIFMLLVALVLVYSALAGLYHKNFVQKSWYLGPTDDESAITVGFRSVGTFIVLFSAWIPISLFVSLESVRVFQALFFFKDDKMKSSDGRRMVARSTNLNDTLGLVHTILSDKTGTLTRNVMEFVACAVDGDVFDIRTEPGIMQAKADEGNEKVKLLVTAMAVCNSVVPDYHGDEEGEILEHPNYQGQSPDEVALVSAGRECGVEMLQRSVEELSINAYGEVFKYVMLGEVEFDSDRKRMSMVFRVGEGQYRVFTKGADTTMFPRVIMTDEVKNKLDRHLHTFAVEGLRTLVFASKDMNEEQFQAWDKQWKEAQLAVENREDKIAAAAEVVESDMTLIGVTAVEDKLQDEVPETIQFLRDAGIALWVLTGDKRETAENIGYSASMLNREMTVVHMEADSQEEMANILDREYRIHVDKDGFPGVEHPGSVSIRSLNTLATSADSQMARSKGVDDTNDRSLAIIIDGKSLQFVLEAYSNYFLQLTDHCKTVICCRVTPMQKALVVRMVKSLRGLVTLAIGDGGNDVSMIQEADVGVGLYGKEGTQAARSADFAIGEFRLLKRLLCVHGHYSWVRNPGLINVSFYKNVLITMGQVYYQFFCQFSGTSIHNEYIVTVYNVALTLFNPIFFALFEKDLDEETLLAKPAMYSANRARVQFGKRTVFEWVLGYALWHSICTFWGQYGAFGGFRQTNWFEGREAGLYAWGFGLSTQTIIIVLVKMLLMAREWSWIYMLASVVSLAMYFVLTPMLVTVVDDYTLLGALTELFSSGTFWITFIASCTASFMLDFFISMMRRFVNPDAITIEQQQSWSKSFR